VSVFTTALEPKRIELLRELVPNAALIAVFIDPNLSGADVQLQEVQAAARKIGQQIRIVNVSRDSDLQSGFATLVEAGAGALAIAGGPFLNSKH
jgi:putative ABC transport system substrate-binding protein